MGTPSAADRASRPADANGIADLWVIRVGESGIQVTFEPSQRHYYAPAPLSRSLQSSVVTVREYISGPWHGGPEDYTEVKKGFNDEDVDVWASDCLAAIDAFLSPDLSVAVAQVAPGQFQEMMKQKEKLAAEIKKGLIPVLADDQPDARAQEAAREAFFQRILITLDSAYQVNAVVQVPARVEHHGDVIEAKLFGSVKDSALIAADQPKSNSFSTGKLPLADPKSIAASPASLSEVQYLTFLFTAADPTRQTNYQTSVAYDVTYVEHDFAPLDRTGDDDPRYVTSSWLKLVQPFGDAAQNIEVDIPIPLRFYPPVPLLKEQRADAKFKPQSSDVRFAPASLDDPILKEVTEWTYSFAYDQAIIAQDTVTAEVTFNAEARPEFALTMTDRIVAAGEDRDPPRSLFEALARFTAESPAIAAHYPAILRAANEGQDPKEAEAVIRRFVELVIGVVEGWKLHNQQAVAEGQQSDRTVVNTYRVEERPPDLLLKGSQKTDWDPSWPEWPEIAGFTLKSSTDDEALYEAIMKASRTRPQTVGSLRSRQFSLRGQSMLRRENGFTAVRVQRNTTLGGSRQANERFRYETPWVSFPETATPTALVDQRISLADFPGTTLPQKLEALFRTLFHISSEPTGMRLIKLETSYLRPQAKFASGEVLTVRIPLTLTDNYAFRLDSDWNPLVPGSFVCRLSATLQNEVAARRLPRKDCHLSLDLSLFAELTGTRHLLLRLKRIEIPVGEDDWWICRSIA